MTDEKIITTFETKITWFKIKDKLPPRQYPVLVYMGENEDYMYKFAVASLCSWEDVCNSWHFISMGFEPNEVDFEDVILWADLPEMP